MYVNKIEIYKFKAKNIVIWSNVLLGSVSQDFARDEQNEISLNGTAYDFSFHHSSIKKEDIFKDSPIFNDLKQYKMSFLVHAANLTKYFLLNDE